MPTIGIDLDNTLIDYSDAYPRVAELLNLPSELRSRTAIRRSLRGPGDDLEWQRFQSVLYTEGLQFAKLALGAADFLAACKAAGVIVHVVSHKTERGPDVFGAREFRPPAREWLKRKGVTPSLVAYEDVHFLSTAKDKVDEIADLNLLAFVDDLEAVLAHPDWPASTRRILFTSSDDCSNERYVNANFTTLRSMLLGGSLF